MVRAIIYIIIGYLSGSVLYANVFSRVFRIKNVAEESRDGNPGTANAFMHGGFFVGTSTLICELSKGIVPVFLYTYGMSSSALSADFMLPFVISAPLVGHIFPVFYRFRGGKGVAVTFGVLLGLCPHMIPALTLAFYFIFFSLVLRVKTHFHRTMVTYFFTAATLFLLRVELPVSLGFLIIAAAVQYKLHMSREERQKFEVSLLWMH